MTDSELLALWEKATRGEWTVEIEEYGNSGCVTVNGLDRLLHDTEWADPEDFEQDQANADFIAAAHNALPSLLERLARAEAEQLRLQDEVDSCRKELLLSRGNFATLRKLTEAALPDNMGGYPDLFYPDGFRGGNDSDHPWELWQSAVQIELKYIDEAERLRKGGA